jgi:hypothetical protein
MKAEWLIFGGAGTEETIKKHESVKPVKMETSDTRFIAT